MAIFAILIGSVTGWLAALSSALVHGTGFLGLLGIYFSVGLLLSGALIAAALLSPQTNLNRSAR